MKINDISTTDEIKYTLDQNGRLLSSKKIRVTKKVKKLQVMENGKWKDVTQINLNDKTKRYHIISDRTKETNI